MNGFLTIYLAVLAANITGALVVTIMAMAFEEEESNGDDGP